MTLPSERVPDQTVPHPPLHGYHFSGTQRLEFLTNLFDQTASDYRWINLVMSLGSGVWYRRRALREAKLSQGMKVLDVACGSGLITYWAADIVRIQALSLGSMPAQVCCAKPTNATALTWSADSARHCPFPTTHSIL